MIQPSILIVEDEAVVAEDLAQKVTALGYRVIGIASTGEIALQLAQEQLPSLVLLDIKLDGKFDGIETAHRLRELCDLPFIFLTAHSDPDTVKRASAAGTFGYILKPFRERDLEVQLETALYKHRANKASAYLDLAQKAGSVGFFDYHFEQDRAVWTEGLAQLFGISANDYEGTWEGWAKRVVPEDALNVRRVITACVNERLEHVAYEFRAVLPDGTIRCLAARAQIFYGADRKPLRMTGVNYDISDRKQAEERLKNSEDLLLRAQHGAQAGVWEIDLRTDRITWSEPYCDLVGLPHSTEPSIAAWLSCIHPEDRERVLAGKRNQNIEFRIVKPNGDVRWVQRQGQIELDEQGNARRINGITFDITERKQADEVIKAIALFPAQNPAPVLRVSAAGILLYMNPVSEQLLRDLHLRVGQPVPIILENLVGNALKATEPQQTEYPLGSCHYLLTISPVAEGNYANLYWTDITQRKRAEEALRESEHRLTGLVSTAMDAIISVDGNQQIRLFNRAAEEMFGCPADQAIGQPLDRFIPERYRKAHHDHVVNFGRTGTTTRRMGKFGTVYGLRADGEEFPLEASISHLDVMGEKLFTVILRDITQRVRSEQALRETEQALRESDEHLTTALAAGQMGTWDIHLVTGAIIWDAKQHEIFGLPANKPPLNIDEFYALVHPSDIDRVKQAAAAAELSGQFSEEFRIIRPDGSVRWIIGQGAIVRDEEGHPIRMVGVNYDTTERKVAQLRVERFADELEQKVARRTEQLVHSQEDLRRLATELNLTEQRERKRLATELHDHLQQILVLGKLKLGQGKRFADTVPTGVTKMINETDALLSDALTYTRTLVAELSPPVLRDHGLAAALKWLGEYMKKHDLTVTVTVPEEESPPLPEDQALILFQSARELLINSSKHAQTREACVTLKKLHGQIEIEVRDYGTGFDTSTPFAAPAAHPGGLSSGFGLFSIRERMKALGGSFDIQSSPAHGTTATLRLPLGLKSGEDEKSKLDLLDGKTARTETQRSKSILLIDGHDKERQYYAHRLKVSYPDYMIFEAPTGQAGLDLYNSQSIHCVILELGLPDMSGFEVLTKLVPIARRPEVPVIVLTKFDNQALHEVAAKNGALVTLQKSITSGDDLDRVVLKAIATIQRDAKKDVAAASNVLLSE